MMMRKKREIAESERQVSPQIDTLLLIDRNVDLLTPLITQLTYEGLIDEFFHIQNSKLFNCLVKHSVCFTVVQQALAYTNSVMLVFF